jgi:hypothetical protein
VAWLAWLLCLPWLPVCGLGPRLEEGGGEGCLAACSHTCTLSQITCAAAVLRHTPLPLNCLLALSALPPPSPTPPPAAEYTVVHEVSVAKVPKEAPLDKVCLLGCGE